jgi:nucleotide-binding universal stress UspA family protein
MAKRLLVPVDGSPHSERAVAFAADEWPDATLLALYVIDPTQTRARASAIPSVSEEWYAKRKEEAAETLSRIAEATDADVETLIEVGRPARTIVKVAGERDVDHVVVGSHGREGVSRVLLGSVAETVARKSPVPVTIVR